MHRGAPCTAVHHHLCAPAPWCITVVGAPGCTLHRVHRMCEAPASRCFDVRLRQGAWCCTSCDPANVCEDVCTLARLTRQTRHTPTAPTARQTRQARQHPTGPDSTRQPCRQHPTAPDSTHPQLTPEENREHTREAHRPMPEDADQDILERLVCLWPTCACGRQRGPTELSSHAKVEELS